MRAEGIKVGQEASYAQTRSIYSKFNEARKHAAILHLNVAQYCQGEGKDVTVFSRRADGDIAFLQFTDDLFPLRQLGVTVVSDSKSRKSIETLRQTLLNQNTAGADILDFAEIMTADTIVEMVSIGRRSRERQMKEAQETRAHEEKLLQMELDNQNQQKEIEAARTEQSKERDREAKVQVAEIQALGRASDKQSDMAGIQAIKEAADQAIQERQHDEEMGLQKEELQYMEKDEKEL